MEDFICSIKLWPCNFAPRGWEFCDGRLLSIHEHPAVFSLLGTTYGGDGIRTFGLPDLRGRVPVGAGDGRGLEPLVLGEMRDGMYELVRYNAHGAFVDPANTATAVPAVPQHQQRTPGLGLNYIIALQGIFPSRS